MSSNDHTSPPLAVDTGTLTHVVQSAIGSDMAEVEQWQLQPAGPSRGAATVGVYRVAGTAHARGTVAEWALILKVIRPGAAAFNPAAREVGHPIYWKREALAYQSGLLDDLPGGISAPRCFAVEERADESCWLWLEEVHDDFGPRWPVAQYGEAAHRLGRFNGAYLVGRPIPDFPWLGPPGALRGTLEGFAFVQDVIRDPATWARPLLGAAFPRQVVERLIRLWDTRNTLLDALDRTPITLCHKDAFRRNMFAPRGPDGQTSLVMIDWAYVGRGELGLDIADLFGASYGNFDVETTDLRALDVAFFEGYLAGLREAGWRGDARLARFGFAASASLKYGSLLVWLDELREEGRSGTWAELSGQPVDTFVQHKAALVRYLLDLADEAHDLVVCRINPPDMHLGELHHISLWHAEPVVAWRLVHHAAQRRPPHAVVGRSFQFSP